MSTKTLNSPKKPLQPSLSFHSDSPPSTSSPSLSYPDCLALSEDYTLESTSFLRTLLKSSQERLEAVERHWKDSINSLDHRVKGLSLERFVNEFRGDMESALREVVREEVGMRPMGIVEQSARKRKRFGAISPNGKNVATDDEADLFASTTSKKLRSGGGGAIQPPSSVGAQQGKGKKPVTNVPGSVKSKKGGMIALNGVVSPMSTRKPARLRLRPSTTVTGPSNSTASSSTNFIYRQPSSGVPPTPITTQGSRASTSTNASSFKTISRKPRRGESIVIRSLNDSPLGEFVAEEDEEEGSEDQEEGEGEDGEWDLMERNEASMIEDQDKKKISKKGNKLKGSKGKPPSQQGQPLSPSVSQTRVPSSTSFGISLPKDAPSYDELKKRWREEMLEKLKGLEESGDLQRKGLEGVLGLLG